MIALASLAPAEISDAKPGFLVAAHRGGRGTAPENTLGAFRQTHGLFGEQGVWLEMDLHLTANGIPVIIHDTDLSRTTTCEGFVHEKTLAQLATCDASKSFPGWGAFEPIPTLAQVLDEGCEAGWRLMIEIKDIPTEPDFDATGIDKFDGISDALIAQRDCLLMDWANGRMLFQSFWPPSLDHVEAEHPEFSTILLTTSNLSNEIGFPATSNVLYASARGYEISAPDEGASDLDATTISLAHTLGRSVIPWTVNDESRIDALAAAGADGVITDYPARAY